MQAPNQCGPAWRSGWCLSKPDITAYQKASGPWSAAGQSRGARDAGVRPRTGEADRAAVGGRLDPDLLASRWRVDHQALADHDTHVTWSPRLPVGAGEEHQVAWLDLASRHP